MEKILSDISEKCKNISESRNNDQINRMTRSSSLSFVENNIYDIFGPSVAMTQRYISQIRINGYLRSNFERESIANYVNKCREIAYNLGMNPIILGTKE